MRQQQQIDTYHKNGYITVEKVFSEKEIDDLRQASDESVSYTHLTLPTIYSV